MTDSMKCAVARAPTILRGAVAAFLLAFALGQAQADSNIGWADTATRPLPVPAGAALQAVAPAHPLHLAVALKPRDEAALEARIHAGAELLSRADYLRRHAPHQADVDALVQHLQMAGFSHVRATPSRMVVEAVGMAADAARAFQVQLASYAQQGQVRVVALSSPRLPAALALQVTGVLGLQSSSLHTSHPGMARDAVPRTAAADVQAHFPQDFARIYNARSLPVATGSTVAVIGFGFMGWAIEDLTSFAADAGYPAPAVRVVRVGPDSDDTSGAFEWSEDSQLALAAAGGQLKETLLYAGWDISDASLLLTLDAAVSDNLAQTLSFGMLGDEYLNRHNGWTRAADALLKVAAAQGQTLMVTGGNNGSRGCSFWSGHEELGHPAVSPWAIAVAGAQVRTDHHGEAVGAKAWHCSVGGLSGTEVAPSWQLKSGVLGGATARGIPDVSLSTATYVKWGNGWTTADHAGVGMAIFAGLWARLQDAHGQALGFAGPVLYKSGVVHPESFWDVTKGRNTYHQAAPGWDFITGFGMPDLAGWSISLP
jgi:pseudomonalisin